MTYVPTYAHDVFISYAHVDDEPEPGESEGWVTTLVSALKNKLAQKLGRSDAFSLWMDHELSGHQGVTDQITGALERTATLVVVLSPGYVASEWCRRETSTFLKHLGERRTMSPSQIFVVHRDKLEDTEQPQEFRELKGYRFWAQDGLGKAPYILGTPRPSPTDLRYHHRLNDLVLELTEELRTLKQNGPRQNGKRSEPDQRPTVFLAEPTDDLDMAHDDLKRYLQQAGLRVLPECWYARDPVAFQETADRDLAQCQLFVQLLSSTTGKRTSDVPKGYGYLQLQRAQAAAKPILQWRNLDLDVQKVSDLQHRALLERDTVLAVGIEEFKRTIKDRMLRKEPESRPKPIDAFVFIDRESEDCSLAEQVCESLKRYGAGYILPDRRGTPAEIRHDLERNLLDCDALIVVYGATDSGWVEEQLRQCRKVISKRERPLQAVAVYEGPPEPKQRLNVNLPKMFTIDCRKGLDEFALNTFLKDLT